MTGTLDLRDVTVVEALTDRMRHYQSVRVSATQRVVLIPPIGSFLVDWDDCALHVSIAANTQRDLDELMAALDDELRHGPHLPVRIDWVVAAAVPVPFR